MPNGPLRRSREHRLVAGVLGGLADYLGMPPLILRIAFAAITVLTAGFPGTLVYLALWFLIPESLIG